MVKAWSGRQLGRAWGHLLDYLDFELEVRRSGEGYEVLTRSLAGEARGLMRLPFRSDEERKLRLRELEAVLQVALSRRVLDPGQQVVRQLGTELFEALMTGEVGSSFRVSRNIANAERKGLRLKLRLQTPELASLPWEFIHDPRLDEYLGLSTWTPIVRYLDSPHELQPLAVRRPLRILGMVSAPSDLPPLKVTLEQQLVEEALETLTSAGAVELQWLQGQTWRHLQKAMDAPMPWHVFHFVGHGRFDRQRDEGQVAFADEDGSARFLSATDLGTLLFDHRSLRLAVLNACEGAAGGTQDILSSTASILVQKGLPAVVAMQFAITDTAAVEFARTFYSGIATGSPIDASLAQARRSMRFANPDSFEWATPVLYMHASNGVLFNVRPDAADTDAVEGEHKHNQEREAEQARRIEEEARAAPKADEAQRGEEEANAARKAEAEAEEAYEREGDGAVVGGPVTVSRHRRTQTYILLCASAIVVAIVAVVLAVSGGQKVTASSGANRATQGGADAASKYRAAVLADHPVSYWLLNETSGRTAHDQTGNDNGMIKDGVTLGRSGPFAGAGAMGFDGRSGYIDLSGNSAVHPRNAVTVEAWVKTSATSAKGPDQSAEVVRARASGYAIDINFNHGRVGLPAFGVDWSSSGYAIASGKTPVNDAKWHYLVGTDDGSSAKLYVDGHLVAKLPASPGILYGGTEEAIGDGGQCGCDFVNGDISEVAVYRSALSARQVAAHYVASGHASHG